MLLNIIIILWWKFDELLFQVYVGSHRCMMYTCPVRTVTAWKLDSGVFSCIIFMILFLSSNVFQLLICNIWPPCVCVYVCVYVCESVCESVSVCLSVCFCAPVSVCGHTCVCIYVSVCCDAQVMLHDISFDDVDNALMPITPLKSPITFKHNKVLHNETAIVVLSEVK